MILQSPISQERRCPHHWLLAAVCGLLSATVLAAGFTVKAAAEPPKDEPKKEEPKKVEPKVDQPPPLPDLPGFGLDELLKNLTGEIDADQLKMLHTQMQEMRERMKKAMEQHQNGLDAGFGVGLPPGFPGSAPREVRLGVSVEKPGDALADQLELPKDTGLVIRDVIADSAAAKAGLKVHDILLELDGKAVSSDPAQFRKAVEGIKADAPVDAVVLRKGRKETVKGLSLPEVKAVAPGVPPGFPNLPLFPDALPGVNLPAVPPGLGVENHVDKGATTTVRNNEHFITRHQEGGLTITLTGKVADDKATVSEVKVKDGAETHSYDSVNDVPERYRDIVKNLVEMSGKGSVQVDLHAR